MDESKAQTQVVGNSRCTLCAAGIRTDNDRFSEAWDLAFNVPLQEGLAVKVIDGYVKETLVSVVVQVSADSCAKLGCRRSKTCLQILAGRALQAAQKIESIHTEGHANPS